MVVRTAESAEDRRKVIAVAHAANAVAAPLATYMALRMASPLRRRATWWLVEEEGIAVASLLAYPLVFGHGGSRYPGYGLGSVATRPEARGRGHASALCEAVAAAAGDDDRGLLFSAIAPAFYQRLGFEGVAAYGWRIHEVGAVEGPRAELVPIDPLAHLDDLDAAWRLSHAGVYLARDEQGWRRSVAQSPMDVFFAVEGGYLRLCDADGELEVVEVFATDPAAVVRSVCDLAAVLGRTVVTWHPLSVADGIPKVPESRVTTRPMLRKLPTAGAAFWASDYF